MRSQTTLPLLIGALVLAATTAGIFTGGEGNHIAFTTIRGEHATYQGSGLYRYDPASVAREGKVWDVITLVVALPMLVVATVFTRRGSLRGRILLAGVLCYLFYMYFMYAVMVALNPMFLVYVAIFSLCPIAVVRTIRGIDLPHLPTRFSLRFPRRTIAGMAFAMAGLLIVMWTSHIVQILIANKFPDDIAGMTTLETQAMDLGLVVPFAIASGWLLVKRTPMGYLFAGIFVSFGFIMNITIPAWIAVPLIQDGKIAIVEALPFVSLCLIGLVLSVLYFRSIHERAQL